MVHNYGTQIYDSLKDFVIARENLDRHVKSLECLGKIICRYGLSDRLGISLLHKHFDLRFDEQLIEKFYENQTQIAPRIITDDTTVTPYLWKTDGTSWHPLEFCITSDLPRQLVELSEQLSTQQDLLTSLAQQLAALDLSVVFGLTLLHRCGLTVQPGELLVETTNHQARTFRWAAQLPKASSDLTPTVWKFQANGSKPIVNYCGHCGHS